jgi:hypothetical protein
VQEAKTLPAKIILEDKLISLLHEHNKNLLFKKTTLEGGYKSIFDANSDKWKLDTSMKEDWVTTMVRRTRNMCRVVGQPISKGTFPVWFKKLAIHIEAAEAPASDDVSGLYGSDGEEESSDGDSKPLSSWDVKFNKELMIATRSSIAEPRQQISQPIGDNPDAADIDMVHAAFVTEAGTISMVIPGLTFEGLRKLSRAVHAAPGRLWSQEHTSTKHRIYIEQRVDRKLLLSLYEQS